MVVTGAGLEQGTEAKGLRVLVVRLDSDLRVAEPKLNCEEGLAKEGSQSLAWPTTHRPLGLPRGLWAFLPPPWASDPVPFIKDLGVPGESGQLWGLLGPTLR